MDESTLEALANDVKSLSSRIIEDAVDKITAIWTAVYPMNDPTEWRSRYKALYKKIESHYTTLLDEEEEMKMGIIRDVEDKFAELHKLQAELSITIDIAGVNESDPLSVMSSALDGILQSHREEKKNRIERLRDLRERESELCDLLEAEPLGGIPHVPSEVHFAALEENIRRLTAEKDVRTDRYRTIRCHVHGIMTALEETPATDFERLVFRSELFPLTPSNMLQLEALKNSYEGKLEEATSHCSLLRRKLEKLWALIKETPEYQKEFFDNNSGVGKSAVQSYNEEIARAEKIKLANMKPVIEGLRQKIVAMWDRLLLTEEQRQFDPLHSTYLSEEVMELHEIELYRLEQQYEESEPILMRALEREELLARREQLELRSKDKGRLNNRGGQLLREEKERKALEKKFPRIEENLLRLLEDYENQKRTPFLFRGVNLLEKIKEERQNAESKKMVRSTSSQQVGCKRAHNGLSSTNSSRVITRSQTPHSDVSTASCASYSHFQSNLGEPTFATPKRMAMTASKTPSRIPRTPVAAARTPGRTPLRPIQTNKPTSAYRATSSPRSTPNKRSKIPASFSTARTPHRVLF